MASTSSPSVTETGCEMWDMEYKELPLVESTRLDYVNEWVNLTVEDEMSRGTKLREEKRQFPRAQKKYNVVSFNNKNSPCSESDKTSRKSKRSRRIKIKGNSHGSESTYRSYSPCSRVLSKTRIYTNRTNKYSCSTPSSRSTSKRRCPLRLAELACPSKRKCIENWRSRADTLPSSMVQRLKKYVMDESPIVEVSDAITCFKRRKSQRSRKKVTTDETKFCSSPLKNAQDMMEIRNLCAMFGHKIAKKLIKPLNITLTEEFQRVSDVVYGEIANILRGKPRLFGENCFNKAIHEEISNKVTLWIATILQDSSYKLLEEDLRAKKNKERRLGKEEKLVTLIENQLQTYRRGIELEEEEGPALDFIDSLVNNVVKICIVPTEMESDTGGSFASSDQLLRSNGDDSEQNKDYLDSALEGTNSIVNMINMNLEQESDLSNQFKSKIDQETDLDFISDIDAHDFSYKDATDGENDTNDSSGKINIVSSISNMKRHPLVDEIDNIANIAKDVVIYEDAEIGKDVEEGNVAEDNSESNANPNTIALEGKEALNDLIATFINEDDAQVSEVFVELSEELRDFDERNKKVKFSNTEMVTRGEPTGGHSIRNSIENHILNHLDHNIMMSFTMSFDNKPDILIAPPNDHLLSDADELWPEDICTPMLKISESVSKSISSLGNIIENEEKLSNSQDEDNIRLTVKAMSDEESVKIIDPDSSKHGELYHQITSQNAQTPDTNAEDDFEFSDSSIEPPQIIQEVKVKIYKIKGNEKELKENIDSEKNNDTKENIKELFENIIQKDTIRDSTIKQSQLKSSDAKIQDVGKGDHNDDDSGKNIIFDAVQQIIEPLYKESKIDYRVDSKTAPAWALLRKPSEDSLLNFSKISTKQKLKESDVRKWCKDLEQAFINLEQWNNWVESTCKKVIFYKQRREMNKEFAQHTRKTEVRCWVKFKKTVNRDAILWTKLSQRTQEILTKYKYSHKNHLLMKEENEKLLYRRHANQEYVLKTLDEFDRNCFWLHRLIVSTECCMKCNCNYNNSRNPENTNCFK